MVILDDDPTGIQTVHGCLSLTRWNPQTLSTAFEDKHPFFYILTNTRSLDAAKARTTIADVMRNVLTAAPDDGSSLMVISRSDSTLRSHFPVEVNEIIAAMEAKGGSVDAIFLVPAFFEGNRTTVGNVHYLKEGDRKIPTSESEFARDSVFGYRSSVLPEYIEEKTGGTVKKENVQSISLEMLRSGNIEPLNEFIGSLTDKTYVVVNAENYDDLSVFTEAVHRASANGKSFAFQSAASIVKSLAGIPDKPLLGKEIYAKRGNGLIVVGSHVKKTTQQLEVLLKDPDVRSIEVNVDQILKNPSGCLKAVEDQIALAWKKRKTPIVFTSRTEKQFPSKEERLAAGEKISTFLVDVVKQVPPPLAWLIAKGGITSHDVLVHGLGVESARVLGQILPGIPVIKTPGNVRLKSMPYVIFPGNVGDENALHVAYRKLAKGE